MLRAAAWFPDRGGPCVARLSRIAPFRCLSSTLQSADDTASPSGRSAEPPTPVIVSGLYSVDRVRLGDLEKRVVALQSPKQRWFLTADKDWAFYSRKPSEEAGEKDGDASLCPRMASHVAVSKRGPVVLVNCGTDESQDILDAVATVSSPLKKTDVQLSEQLRVLVDGDMDEWCARRDGNIVVQRLDLNNVRILSAILAQTVVLQYYEEIVDRMHEVVATLNSHVENRDMNKLHSESLLRILNENNQIVGDIMLAGLHNISKPGTAAWDEAKYGQLQALLEDEFELEERYDEMERKLAFVTNLIKQCLQLKKDQMMERLEWLIVIILSFEVLLGLRHWL